MDAYLNGFNDPRISVFFQPNMYGEYRGLRNGHKNGDVFKGNTGLSKPNILQGTPYVWMTAAEVYFLRAEGALKGWNMNGNAEDLYNAGIRASFQQHGVKGVESYLASTKTPAKYPGFRSSPSAPAPSNITVAWSEDSEVEQLEQIITQKWIAMYPLGQEAWSEFRRTGYPKLYEIVNNESGGVISSSMQIRRVPFPNSEYQGNKEEVEKAITLLGGPDNGATRLWWDVENK